MRVVGVVVAAGGSTRLGGPTPKQFEILAGRTVVERSVRAIAEHPEVRGVVVVLPPAQMDGERAILVRGIPGVIEIVPGGATRARSVRIGVEAARSASHVLVHDAARPLVSPEVVRSVVLGALAHGAAIPVLPVHETVKEEAPPGFVGRTLDRGLLRLAQTPQGARSDWLLDALARAEADGVEVTDEAQALERAGYRVAVVPGDRGNLKITDARDLEEAKRRLGQGAPGVHAIRVGIGFDIHRFDRTDPPAKLVLGGIEFPGEAGLLGHSDADVVLHAAMDAILGALGAGDIGEHFPDDDPRFRGAASTGLLREVARISEQAGFEVVNLDLTLMAERPRIREKAEAMRRAIAGCLDVPESRIGLKATTLEKLGALGRGEGIACQAVVLLAARS